MAAFYKEKKNAYKTRKRCELFVVSHQGESGQTSLLIANSQLKGPGLLETLKRVMPIAIILLYSEDFNNGLV